MGFSPVKSGLEKSFSRFNGFQLPKPLKRLKDIFQR